MIRMDFEYYWTPAPYLVDGKPHGLSDALKDADTGGIDIVVLVTDAIWRPDNRGLAEAVKEQPRFIGCCQVNPQFGQEAVDELEAGITQWGLRSLKLMPARHNYDISGPLPVPVLDKARELEISLNVHSGTTPGCRPWEIASVADRYPELPIVLDHSGYRDCLGHAISVAQRYPNVHLGTNTVGEPLMIKRMVLEVGADRVVFGSNGPGVFIDLAVEAICRLSLGKEAEDLVLGGNLARIYGIE